MKRPNRLASKSLWRRWARSRWSEVDVGEAGRSIVTGVRRWSGLGGTVLTYLAMPGEVDLAPLIDTTLINWAVTRTPQRGGLTIHPLGSGMEHHALGFDQPVAGSTIVDVGDVDVVLVPGLAFDRAGGRLGRGKGYYDELLATMHGAVFVGVVPEALLVDVLPIDVHDVAMSYLATEEGVLPVNSHH